jgi:hypothetical protein
MNASDFIPFIEYSIAGSFELHMLWGPTSPTKLPPKKKPYFMYL